VYYCIIRERITNNKKYLCVLFYIHTYLYCVFHIKDIPQDRSSCGHGRSVVENETQRTTCRERTVDKTTIRIFMHDPR